MNPSILFLALAALKYSIALAAPEINQTTAQAEAARLNHAATIASLQSSLINAMNSYSSVLEGSPLGAVENISKSYNNYQNGQTLARIEAVNKHFQSQMESGAASAQQPRLILPNVSFAWVDPKFLREGEGAKAAERFEKVSGIKREEFHRQLARLSEQETVGALTAASLGLAKDQLLAFARRLAPQSEGGAVAKLLEAISPQRVAAVISSGPPSPEPAKTPASASTQAAATPSGASAEKANPSPATLPPLPSSSASSSPIAPNFGRQLAARDEEAGITALRNQDPLFQAAASGGDSASLFAAVKRKYRELERSRL